MALIQECDEKMLGKYQRCISCMKEIGTNNVCPHCGYIEGSPFLPDYLPPKTMLNQRYIIGKLLGYNGEGAVYIAFDTVIEAAVEIREYMPDSLCSRERGGLSMVVNQGREAQYKALMSDFAELMCQLTKVRTLTTVARAYEVFEENNTVYAVFEHIEGITLRQYLNDHAGEIGWAEASKLFFPLFGTLAALHSSNIFHRGISPETLLLNNKGEIKLTGFSISPLRASGTELSPQLFSGYAAPEQYSSNSWHGSWTDVYALSAVIYKSLTGTMPPDATTRSINDNLVQPHILNPAIPKPVSQAIMAALLLSPEQRTQTMIEFRNQLYQAEPAPAVAPAPKAEKKEIVEPKEEEKKKGVPAWAIALLITSSVLLVVLALLLVLMLGEGEPTNNPVSSTPSVTSSESVSDLPTSSQTSSSIDMADFIVENFIGQTANSVTNNTTYTQKYTFKVEYVWNDSYGNGTIFKQEPEADTAVKAQDTVKLYVSKGPRFVKVPSHNNMKQADYESELRKVDIELYSFETEISEGIRPGYVIRTNMDGGTYDKESIDSAQLIIYIAAEPPVSSEESPTSSDEAPISSEETPISSEETPVSSEEAPVSSEETPVTSNDPGSAGTTG